MYCTIFFLKINPKICHIFVKSVHIPLSFTICSLRTVFTHRTDFCTAREVVSLNLKKTFSFLFFFCLVWIGLRWLLPLFAPFLLGGCLALAAEPMVSFLQRRLRVPRAVGVGIGVSMTFCLLAMATIALCAFLVRELGILARVVPDLGQAAQSSISVLRQWLLSLTEHTPQSVKPLLRNNVDALFSDGAALLNRVLSYVLGLAGNLLSHVPDSALGLGTSVLSGYMVSAKLPTLRLWLQQSLNRQWIQSSLQAWGRIKHAVAGWLAAQFKLMSVSFFILTLGLTLLRIPNALFWAIGITFVDALPVLGIGTVLLPWGLLCFLQEDPARGIGLIGIYVAAALLRSVLEPRLLGRHLGLDPLVTLMVLYVGFKLWGLPGMLVAPLLTVALTQIISPGAVESTD